MKSEGKPARTPCHNAPEPGYRHKVTRQQPRAANLLGFQNTRADSSFPRSFLFAARSPF